MFNPKTENEFKEVNLLENVLVLLLILQLLVSSTEHHIKLILVINLRDRIMSAYPHVFHKIIGFIGCQKETVKIDISIPTKPTLPV